MNVYIIQGASFGGLVSRGAGGQGYGSSAINNVATIDCTGNSIYFKILNIILNSSFPFIVCEYIYFIFKSIYMFFIKHDYIYFIMQL